MSKQQDSALEVWLTMTSALHVWSARWLIDRGQIRFHYERTGSKTPRLCAGPGLSLDEHPFFRSRTGQLRDLPGLIA